ncbi:hypothetical protein [uncultured Methylovirgula sp.]|uniref:hypothetical protein n=1 Tax=uncultured Methylovirgula sp. TaxID=1285960 RepID=UPI00262055FE|nr:hypothetical protein [uncultured Methylovirgula sp.]
MTARTFVYIVCSLSGRVGKTTVARLLGDYFLASRRAFRGFDTDAHEPDFATRFPEEVVIADLNTIQGQMALIDPLLADDGVPKIIDLWHRALEGFFTLVDNTGFIAEARARGVEPILLYVDDGPPRAAEVVARIEARYPDLQVIVVKNEATSQEPAAEPGAPQTLRSFRIGKLDPVLCATIELPGFSLSRFMLAPPPDMSIVLRAALRDWIWRIFSQFKSFELRMTLSETEHL